MNNFGGGFSGSPLGAFLDQVQPQTPPNIHPSQPVTKPGMKPSPLPGQGLGGGNGWNLNDSWFARFTPWDDQHAGNIWDNTYGKHGLGGKIGDIWDSQFGAGDQGSWQNMSQWNMQHNPIANMWDNTIGGLGKSIGNWF